MFSTSTSPSKWVTEPAFEVGTSAASPSTKMLGFTVDCSVALSRRDEPEFVAETRRVVDVVGPTVERDHDSEVEVDFATVVADQLAGLAVDLTGVELGDDARCPSPRAGDQTSAEAIGFVKAPSSGVT